MPRMTPHGFAYVAFREHEQGASSRALFTSPVWRRWLLDATRVAELFNQAERRCCASRRREAQSVSTGASTRSRRLRVPLPSSLVNVGDRVVDFFDRGGDAPYLLYVYKPSEEYAVRRDLGELRLWLEAKQVNCVPISLADLFWQALEESGWLEPLLEEERRAKAIPRPWAGSSNRLVRSCGSLRHSLTASSPR